MIEWKDIVIIILGTLVAIMFTPLGNYFDRWVKKRFEDRSESSRRKKLEQLKDEYVSAKLYQEKPVQYYSSGIARCIIYAAMWISTWISGVTFFLLAFVIYALPENHVSPLLRVFGPGVFTSPMSLKANVIVIGLSFFAGLFFLLIGVRYRSKLFEIFSFIYDIRTFDKYEEKTLARIKELEERDAAPQAVK